MPGRHGRLLGVRLKVPFRVPKTIGRPSDTRESGKDGETLGIVVRVEGKGHIAILVTLQVEVID